jgi:hypothetical protein
MICRYWDIHKLGSNLVTGSQLTKPYYRYLLVYSL